MKKRLWELFSPQEKNLFSPELEKKVKTFQTTIRNKEGLSFPVKLSMVPVNSLNFYDKLFLCIIEDLTPQKSVEAQLIQAQKMEAIALLTGGIVHDFNNILTTILGYTDLVLMAYEKKDVIRSYVEEIKTAGERAALLINQLLSFTRKSNESVGIIDLNVLIKDMLEMIRRLIGENIKLEVKLGSEKCLIRGKSVHIQQILMNLIVNAKDAMERGGTLTIETKEVYIDDVLKKYSMGTKPGKYIILSVSDTGIGMDRETSSRIFEPFFTTKKDKNGTGLGLSTVYAIVKQYGGTICVSSELGRGTKFDIYFPFSEIVTGKRENSESVIEHENLEKPDKELSRELFNKELYNEDNKDKDKNKDKNNEEEVFQSKTNVLIVEDDDLVREFIAQTLINFGFKVLIAENPTKALKILENYEGELNLLISDVVMSDEINIDDFVEAVFEKYPAIKVIYVSGYNAEAFGSVRNHPGKSCFFLKKPITPVDIIKKINEAIGYSLNNPSFNPSKN